MAHRFSCCIFRGWTGWLINTNNVTNTFLSVVMDNKTQSHSVSTILPSNLFSTIVRRHHLFTENGKWTAFIYSYSNIYDPSKHSYINNSVFTHSHSFIQGATCSERLTFTHANTPVAMPAGATRGYGSYTNTHGHVDCKGWESNHRPSKR